ncbi:MAG: SUMF1/EgtB/PvdO family nonheme iron enzyme [Candidatus Coatesbacteria bacterium]|nr:SUMF1/EgtB/PvdO family nonheme iron enzyme [Candidatus Coatesbacteria bacterium]
MRSFRLLSLSLMMCLIMGLTSEIGTRAVELKNAAGDWPFLGDYHLLCIGIDDYAHWPRLNTSVADADALAEVLLDRYGFGSQHLVKLYNSDATEGAIKDAFRKSVEKLRPEDWLLVYFGGHCSFDELTGMEAWVPVDAKRGDRSRLVEGEWLRGILKAMPARHVLVICDSCFSENDISTSASAPINISAADRRETFDRTSREVITHSGSLSDKKGSDGLSIFGNSLMRILNQNKQPYLLSSELYDGIRLDLGAKGIVGGIGLETIAGTGSELGGSFVFVCGLQRELDELDRMIEKKQQTLATLEKKQARIKALDDERQARIEQKKKKLAELESRIEKLSQELVGPVPDAPCAVPDVRTEWTEPNTGMQFVWIPGDCFEMGSPLSDNARDEDEGPVHEVCLDGYWIGKYEVTNAEYRTFRPEHNSGSYHGFTRNEPDQPVVFVSWADAMAFAKHLSAIHAGKYEFRLPTEAEWEYACRAKTKTRYYWGDKIDVRYVNLADKSHPTHPNHADLDDGYAVTAPVGKFLPNAFGLHDMAGNVVEGCYDWYSADAYKSHAMYNPTGPTAGTARVVRGGSYWAWAWNCRSADRGSNPPEKRRSALGFRLVMKERDREANSAP